MEPQDQVRQYLLGKVSRTAVVSVYQYFNNLM